MDNTVKNDLDVMLSYGFRECARIRKICESFQNNIDADCDRVEDIDRLRTLFWAVYNNRILLGLSPWTHMYPYTLSYKVWIARNAFTTFGRYGAKADNIIFVPNHVNVTVKDHTNIIYMDPNLTRKNHFAPVYTDLFYSDVAREIFIEFCELDRLVRKKESLQ